jgi:hypothetical protein
MSREQAAACPLAADQLPLLAVARLTPERSLPELLEASTHVGNPARLAMLHWANCPRCTTAALAGEGTCCTRGARLLERARGWRARSNDHA